MYKLSKDFAFCASHVLHGLPNEHKCSRLHGHNYVARLVLEAENLDETGFVQDYGELDPIAAWITETLDHRHLNDLLSQPSAEHLARWIYDTWHDEFPALVEVAVSETPRTWAIYAPG